MKNLNYIPKAYGRFLKVSMFIASFEDAKGFYWFIKLRLGVIKSYFY